MSTRALPGTSLLAPRDTRSPADQLTASPARVGVRDVDVVRCPPGPFRHLDSLTSSQQPLPSLMNWQDSRSVAFRRIADWISDGEPAAARSGRRPTDRRDHPTNSLEWRGARGFHSHRSSIAKPRHDTQGARHD